jgi:hypothetical protein
LAFTRHPNPRATDNALMAKTRRYRSVKPCSFD